MNLLWNEFGINGCYMENNTERMDNEGSVRRYQCFDQVEKGLEEK